MMPDPLEFSVVIPTRNRPGVLARTLARLAPAEQGAPADRYEVIVSDDSAGEETLSLLKERFPAVRYIRGPRRGPAANRNNGASVARGTWLAFIDDDCEPSAEWLNALRRLADQGEVDVIEGRMVAQDKGDHVLRHPVENLTGDLFWSGNLAVRRDVFDRLGRFDEDFKEACCEDLELSDRIRRSELHTTFCARATVFHPSHIVTVKYWWWRAFLAKWHLLYLHKTGRATSLEAPAWRALIHLVWHRTRELLSVTRRTRVLYPQRPRTALFNVATQWLLFPIVIPYLMYWELRFRDRRRSR
jgi:GT2 family glycosyltransferase